MQLNIIIKAWDLTIIFNRAVINAIIVIAILESITNVGHPPTNDPNDPSNPGHQPTIELHLLQKYHHE